MYIYIIIIIVTIIICIHAAYVYIYTQYYTILYVCIIYTYGTAPPRSCFQRLVSVLIFACSIMNSGVDGSGVRSSKLEAFSHGLTSVDPCDDTILPTNMDPAG